MGFKTYVVLYHHRHGVTPCLIKAAQEPTDEQMYAALEDMGEDVTDRREDEYVEAILVDEPTTVPLSDDDCDSAGCPGWIVTNDNGQIERCDTCKRFANDDEAIAHVHALETLDWSRQFEDAARKALTNVREELSDVIEASQDYPISVEMTETISRLETLIGRSFWLERHRWSENGLQFVRLLSEMYAAGEVSDDTETMEPFGFFVVKVSELVESMDLPWGQIVEILERADQIFQTNKRPPEVKS